MNWKNTRREIIRAFYEIADRTQDSNILMRLGMALAAALKEFKEGELIDETISNTLSDYQMIKDKRQKEDEQ